MNLILKILNKRELLILLAFIIILSSSVFSVYSVAIFQNVHAELAWSFLHGKLHFINEISNPDLVVFNGQNYWHMPPLPAVILMPLLALLNSASDQNLLNLLLNILLFFFIARFTQKKFGFSKLNSYWLAILFLFSSIYINSVFSSLAYNYSQTISTFLVLLSFNEYFGKKRYALIGAFVGLVFLSRLTAGLVIIFYLLAIITEKISWRRKIKNLTWLSIPVLICLLMFGLYNYARFGNPLETGYTQTHSYSEFPELHPYGQFNYKYIPSNLYYYFLEGLTPNYAPVADNYPKYQLAWPYIIPNFFGSISFFIISPLFILLFKADYRNKINQLLLITALIITITLLSYYYNGFAQIGPRYYLDCLPVLFMILLSKLKDGFTVTHKTIIVISSLLNVFLTVSLIYASIKLLYGLK
ncbi:MAG: hypothetical protein NTX82_07325 [Candidatus Parcubacteria bacterium]|nr:hypothetical protein [Candidatus Parcubacteria bacterium]